MLKSFANSLKEHGLQLKRSKTTTLQVNVGLICNLACKHCHLNGSPQRKEIMTRETMDHVIEFAKKNSFDVADITGGAPELVPDLEYLITGLRPLVSKILLRSNLTLLLEKSRAELLQIVKENKVSIVASFPSVNENQTDGQRGKGVWQKSLDNLRYLNSIGYGVEGSDLELDLVSNPAGAFMPSDQCKAEKKFKSDLARKWEIQFTHLFTFANVPLGRFKSWLEKSGNYQTYMEKLISAFNGGAVNNLMCRSLVSVSWDGYLYDCDFNQAAGLALNSTPTHITEIDNLPEGQSIVTDSHCYACTAGAGFT